MKTYKVILHSIDGYIATHSVYTTDEQDAINAVKSIARERFPHLQFDSVRVQVEKEGQA